MELPEQLSFILADVFQKAQRFVDSNRFILAFYPHSIEFAVFKFRYIVFGEFTGDDVDTVDFCQAFEALAQVYRVA